MSPFSAAATAQLGSLRQYASLTQWCQTAVERSINTRMNDLDQARHQLRPNSALISNTMICEVSRLVNGTDEGCAPRSWVLSSAESIRKAQNIDLFSLIEALVLHEKLY